MRTGPSGQAPENAQNGVLFLSNPPTVFDASWTESASVARARILTEGWVATPLHGSRRSERPTLSDLLSDPGLRARFDAVRNISRRVRSSEYHLTNACNIRCEGCWFFAHDFERKTSEAVSPERWKLFAKEQAAQGVTAALLIGGEPTLFPDRVEAFCESMPFVTISSNGLRAFPREGFEKVAIALTLFGGIGADDRLRAILPNGSRFTGLFQEALRNYAGDDRATFIYALDVDQPGLIYETTARIADNGNRLSFNFYSDYGDHPEKPASSDALARLEDEALRVSDLFPDTVLSHPYYTRALISGRTSWGEFGYESCPSISVDHPAHAQRLQNGKPVLPGFNAYSADTKTLAFCCTSGDCTHCRDSQAVQSWLMTNVKEFIRSGDIETWIEVCEAYWLQFVWSPLRQRTV